MRMGSESSPYSLFPVGSPDSAVSSFLLVSCLCTSFLACLALMASEALLLLWAAVAYLNKGVCKLLNWSRDYAWLVALSLMRLYAY